MTEPLDLDAAGKTMLHVIDFRVDYQATCLACGWTYCGTERDLAADAHTLRLEVEQRREWNTALVAEVRALAASIQRVRDRCAEVLARKDDPLEFAIGSKGVAGVILDDLAALDSVAGESPVPEATE